MKENNLRRGKMRKPFISQNGQINMIKVLLYAILFSLCIGFVVKWLDTHAELFVQLAPYFSLSIVLISLVQITILIKKEVKHICSFIRHFAIWIYIKMTTIKVPSQQKEVMTLNQNDFSNHFAYHVNSILRC
jgi:hypothetical protein